MFSDTGGDSHRGALRGSGDFVSALAGALTGHGLPQAAAASTMWRLCRSEYGRTPVESFSATCQTRPVTQDSHDVPTACCWAHRMSYSTMQIRMQELRAAKNMGGATARACTTPPVTLQAGALAHQK